MLDQFASAGRSCALVTPSNLGDGQTLHSHGVLNTGFGFAGPELREIRDRLVLPSLQRLGVETYGDWFLFSPEEVEVGTAASADSLPPGFDPGGARLRRLAELNLPMQRLIAALHLRYRDRIVRSRPAAWRGSGSIESVEVETSSGRSRLTFAPTVVVAATGAGTKRLLTEVAGRGGQFDKIRHRRVHIVCVRGPADRLPAASLLSTQHGLNLVAHRQGQTVTWYSTPFQADDPHFEDVPEDAEAVVDPEVVVGGFERLETVFPSLGRTPELRFTAYAGFRQDIGETVGTRAFERVEGFDNLHAALPSLAVNAWANAEDAGRLVGTLGAPTAQPTIPFAGARVEVAEHREDRPGVRWSTWSEVVAARGVAPC
jgi:hypothetical protein